MVKYCLMRVYAIKFSMKNFIFQRAVRLNTELENVNPNIRRILTYKNASDVEKEFGLLS